MAVGLTILAVLIAAPLSVTGYIVTDLTLLGAFGLYIVSGTTVMALGLLGAMMQGVEESSEPTVTSTT